MIAGLAWVLQAVRPDENGEVHALAPAQILVPTFLALALVSISLPFAIGGLSNAREGMINDAQKDLARAWKGVMTLLIPVILLSMAALVVIGMYFWPTLFHENAGVSASNRSLESIQMTALHNLSLQAQAAANPAEPVGFSGPAPARNVQSAAKDPSGHVLYFADSEAGSSKTRLAYAVWQKSGAWGERNFVSGIAGDAETDGPALSPDNKALVFAQSDGKNFSLMISLGDTAHPDTLKPAEPLTIVPPAGKFDFAPAILAVTEKPNECGDLFFVSNRFGPTEIVWAKCATVEGFHKDSWAEPVSLGLYGRIPKARALFRPTVRMTETGGVQMIFRALTPKGAQFWKTENASRATLGDAARWSTPVELSGLAFGNDPRGAYWDERTKHFIFDTELTHGRRSLVEVFADPFVSPLTQEGWRMVKVGDLVAPPSSAANPASEEGKGAEANPAPSETAAKGKTAQR